MRLPTTLATLRSTFRVPALALAAVVGLSSSAQAAERTTRQATTLVAPEDDGTFDDYTDIDDGIGPDPGVDPLEPADDYKTVVDPLDPADDLATEKDPIVPVGDDLVVGETGQDLWLTAASPWHPTARLTAIRVFEWYPNPAAPMVSFKVDPKLPLDANAKLELTIHAQPGFDYDFYFCVGWSTLDDHGGSLRIGYDDGGEAGFTPDGVWGYSPDSYCDAWGAVAGPELGEQPDWRVISLGIGSLPDETATWEVEAVRVIATPRQ
ncbi:MAG: hypothetical protein IT385_05625 [Deltaproteobacteria bacterium]|nr:hypothetical protein [Deltaproteobacteria bacterium]